MFVECVFFGGFIYLGYLLVCVVVVGMIWVMVDEGIVENVVIIGVDILGLGLVMLVECHGVIGEVCGMGVFWVFELVKDCCTREFFVLYNVSGV